MRISNLLAQILHLAQQRTAERSRGAFRHEVHHRRKEQLLQIGIREILRRVGYSKDRVGIQLDLVVKPLVVKLDVPFSFFERGNLKRIFAIEPAWPFENCWIEFLRMIGGG